VSSEPTIQPTRKTRLDLLKSAGVVAGAAVAAKLATADAADAANGQDLVVGANNTETLGVPTGLVTSGPAGPTEQGALRVIAPNYDYGVEAQAADYGVVGTGGGGVLGLGTVGGVFAGSVVAINLFPQQAAGAPVGEAFKGDLAVDDGGVLWLCVASGAPGTWIRVSHGGVRLLPSPQRAYSTTDVGTTLRMNQGETRTVPIGGVVQGVPSNALGIVANLTVHSTISGGYVIAYPAGTARPATSNINWSATGQSIANGATIALGTNAAISLFADAAVAAGSPATHLIVDIAGYIL
jgi:hypothetical protein